MSENTIGVAVTEKPKEEAKKYMTIEDILSVQDVQYADVPAWGGMIRIGTLSAAQMMEHAEKNKRNEKNAGIRLIIESLVDADGKRIGNPSMIERLGQKNARVLNKIADHIFRLNGLGKTGVDISIPLSEAGTDPEKLEALASELESFAKLIRDAGTDEKALRAIIEDPLAAQRQEAKNA